MDSIISIIFTCFIVYFVVVRLKKSHNEINEVTNKAKASTKNYEQVQNTAKPKAPAKVTVPAAPTYKKPQNNYYKTVRRDGSGHMHKFDQNASVSRLMDDRENDWLANQLREEHKAFRRTSEMFDLKIEHVSHCDARVLSNYHHNTCDANAIDKATT